MDGTKNPKITDTKTARAKAEHYCAYQERSQQEVRDKLYEWGLRSQDVEMIISGLIEDNFINEERFAREYALGKFRQKGWGKGKIKQGLKFKRVPDVLIKKALAIIPMSEYVIALENILAKKARLLAEKDTFKRNYKLRQYAMGRGYESDLVADVLSAHD